MPTKVASATSRPKVKLTKLFIDNKWTDPVDGGEFETYNPATGEVIAKVAAAGAADVDKAVKAARARARNGALEHDGRRRSRPFALQTGRPGRASTPTSWPHSSRSTAARPSPTQRETWAGWSTHSATMRAGPTRSKGGLSRCAATSCRTRSASRSASSARSSPGTFRS